MMNKLTIRITCLTILIICFSCTSPTENKPENQVGSLKSGELKVTTQEMENTIRYGSTIHYQQGLVKRGSIVVVEYFDRFLKKKLELPLRLVGMPGDEVEINAGRILINKQEYTLPKTSKLSYLAYINKPAGFAKIKDYNYRRYNETSAILFLTKEDLATIRSNRLVDSIVELKVDSVTEEENIIKTRSSRYLNAYYFGPLEIPRKGAIIDEDIIQKAPNVQDLQLGEKLKENFYFLIGDNFMESYDSRFIGLLPESAIKGIVI